MRYFFTILFLLSASGIINAQKSNVESGKKMVTIPAGIYKPFFITKNNNGSKVLSFKMDETAVTNQEFLEFVKANPKWQKSKVNKLFADDNYLKYWESDLIIGEKNKNVYNSPVVYVSWFAAKAYCSWKNKKLPSVAQWEFAADAKPKNLKTSLTEYIIAWNSKPNPPFLPNVKSTYVNAYGLYDMHGLVWEWTSDFNSFIGTVDSRGNSEEDFNNFCGAGGVNVKDKKDYASFLRFSYRGSLKGKYCIANLGFRCAKD